MRARDFISKFTARRDGASAVEFGIILMVLIIFTFVLIETSYVYFQWLAAEKATQLGVRKAVVRNPVAVELTTWSGKTGSNEWGDAPPDPIPTVTCVGDPGGATGTCTGTSGSWTFSPSADAVIVQQMNRAFGGGTRIGPENVVITYHNVSLCFVGRPGGACPSVSVSLTGLNFQFFILDSILGLGPISIPPVTATLTGEDMNDVVL